MTSFFTTAFDALAFDAEAVDAEGTTHETRYVTMRLDDALFSIVVGDDAQGWRDITDEAGSFVCSNVRPGGAASCSFTLPADIWALGYNEVRPDALLVARYDGEVFWDGIILPRPVAYQGE